MMNLSADDKTLVETAQKYVKAVNDDILVHPDTVRHAVRDLREFFFSHGERHTEDLLKVDRIHEKIQRRLNILKAYLCEGGRVEWRQFSSRSLWISAVAALNSYLYEVQAVKGHKCGPVLQGYLSEPPVKFAAQLIQKWSQRQKKGVKASQVELCTMVLNAALDRVDTARRQNTVLAGEAYHNRRDRIRGALHTLESKKRALTPPPYVLTCEATVQDWMKLESSESPPLVNLSLDVIEGYLRLTASNEVPVFSGGA